jgi:hypothetical protein
LRFTDRDCFGAPFSSTRTYAAAELLLRDCPVVCFAFGSWNPV